MPPVALNCPPPCGPSETLDLAAWQYPPFTVTSTGTGQGGGTTNVTVTDNDPLILCEPVTGNRVIVFVNNSTGVPVTSLFNLDGTVYAGGVAINDLVACGDAGLESDGQPYCANGVPFTQWVVKDNGTPTGAVFWTDLAGAVVAAPAGAVPGVCGAAFEDIFEDCLCDVDGTGAIIAMFSRLYRRSIAADGTFSSALLGDFTDASGSTSYAVAGTAVECSTVGDAAVTDQERIIVQNGQTWSPNATMRSYTIRVSANSGNGTITFTDSNGVVTPFAANEVQRFVADVNATFDTTPVLSTGPGDIVFISATDVGT